MPVVILPKTTDPDGPAEAQTKLNAAIDNPFTAVMIVLGDGPDVNRVVEVGTARASLAPLRRCVVWAPDAGVLTAKQLKDYSPSGQPAAFIGLDNQVSTRLSLAKAQVAFFVEQAFTDAGG